MADGDSNWGVEGRPYSPSLADSSASTLSLSPPPAKLPEAWEDHFEMARRASGLEVSAYSYDPNYIRDYTANPLSYEADIFKNRFAWRIVARLTSPPTSRLPR